MTMRLPLAAVLSSSFLLGACQVEPGRACERARFSFPLLDIDPSLDQSEDEGIQASFRVESDLLPGLTANLFLLEVEEDRRTFIGSATSDARGGLNFEEVTVPLGEIVLFIEASDECGTHRGGYRSYVWDGLGKPRCSLTLNKPAPAAALGELPVLGPEQDEDAETPGMQVKVLIDAGRPDMDANLFVVDRESGAATDYALDLNSMGRAQQLLTLAEGEQAMRATCYWEPEDLLPSSPTWTFLVDSAP